MNYELNTALIAKLDSNLNRITEAGKYELEITRAESLISQGGARGVGFSFKSDEGATLDRLDIWTHGRDGSETFGLSQLMGIMCCTKTRSLNATLMIVDKYDFDLKQVVKKQVQGYQSLIGKNVGLLLQKVIDIYEGKDTEKLEIFGIFEAGTDYSATEMLNKVVTAEATQVRFEQLMKKPIKDKRKAQQQTSYHAATSNRVAQTFDDSDIPF